MDIDCKTSSFAISCHQQGERLLNYKHKDPNKLYESTDFNIVLMTEDGKFVNARFGHGFTFSLINQDIKLTEGKYIFMVDPVWNESAKNSLEYKQVLIDVFGP